MATSSPFSFLGQAFDKLGSMLQPPAWLTHELQHRTVLFVNHLLMQEPQAQERLLKQVGRTVRLAWRTFDVQVQITPAGLLELSPSPEADLTLTVTDESPLDLVKSATTGQRPAVRIEGDVQLAADINWLVDNLRWDVEEDLARVIGDGPAHTVGNVARQVAGALRGFVDKATSFGSGKADR
jgi:ubiquinone biosynthesis protein UbiJ